METIFKRVKSTVTPKQAAVQYGMAVKRGDMVCCPFHNDQHPSMKLYPDHYHCFSCKATGDVISLTAKLLQLSPYKAAQQLESDFIGNGTRSIPIRIPAVKEAPKLSEEQVRWITNATDTLRRVREVLEDRRLVLAPRSPDEFIDEEFIEICHLQPQVEYLLEMACSTDETDRIMFFKECQKEVDALESSILKRNVTGNGSRTKLSA